LASRFQKSTGKTPTKKLWKKFKMVI